MNYPIVITKSSTEVVQKGISFNFIKNQLAEDIEFRFLLQGCRTKLFNTSMQNSTFECRTQLLNARGRIKLFNTRVQNSDFQDVRFSSANCIVVA